MKGCLNLRRSYLWLVVIFFILDETEAKIFLYEARKFILFVKDLISDIFTNPWLDNIL